MNLDTLIEQILSDNSLDSEDTDRSKCEAIEDLIPQFGWDPIQEYMLALLEDNDQPLSNWETAAQVFWGAVSDNRNVQADRVIALLYHRLPPDEHSDESNLAWSITSKLKGVDYLSEYNLLEDPGVRVEFEKLTRDNKAM